MKIAINEIIARQNKFYSFTIVEYRYIQKQFDYAFKYLDFDKLHKIYLNNIKVPEEMYQYYSKTEYLKNHWGKSIFKLAVWYQDKQELKTIVNRIINIELRNKHNENLFKTL